jgi:hypothetical protein
MNTYEKKTSMATTAQAAVLLLLTLLCVAGCRKEMPVAAEEAQSQSTYTTPEKAGEALQAATRARDYKTLAVILGPKSQEILSSGDKTEDQVSEQSFVAKYERMNRWVAMMDGSQVLYIGADNYPFPIPLAKDASSNWHFDTAAGEDELLARRIGRNELLAMDAARALATAEEDYYRKPHHGEVPQFAQSIPDLTGPAVFSASSEGVPVVDGYSFRVLTAQGDEAKGGAKTYLLNGKMRGGFAILAAPVRYQNSGVMTFMLSREGVVYQKDLGKDTASLSTSISAYNPGDGWVPAE